MVAAGAVAAGVLLADDERRLAVTRQVRVWRLMARRGAHFAVLKVRGAGAAEQERARLEEGFAIKSAEDVAEVLGNMKGAIMKAGQMLSFLADGLPSPARAALATLQADVPPMAPSLAERAVAEELGGTVEELFLDWAPVPAAAASIGQVHKAVMRDGRVVAVKVQYPGVDRALRSDLANAEVLYSIFHQVALRGLDTKGLVEELRDRMGDELDYRVEAGSQAEFARRFAGHPFVRVPEVVPERSGRRVLTSEWVDGMSWGQFMATSGSAARQEAAEVIFRFVQGSIWREGIFNGDPHPGNYRFHSDGSVTFLDFGLVKRWAPGELEAMVPLLDALVAQDAAGTVEAAIGAGLLQPRHGLDPHAVFEYLSGAYEPFMQERFAYNHRWVATSLQKVIDVTGHYGDVVRKLNLPRSYVVLDRVVWGMSALLGKLEADNAWAAILAEYKDGAPPATALGEAEAAWVKRREASGVATA